jgi:hypothetical protein
MDEQYCIYFISNRKEQAETALKAISHNETMVFPVQSKGQQKNHYSFRYPCRVDEIDKIFNMFHAVECVRGSFVSIYADKNGEPVLFNNDEVDTENKILFFSNRGTNESSMFICQGMLGLYVNDGSGELGPRFANSLDFADKI